MGRLMLLLLIGCFMVEFRFHFFPPFFLERRREVDILISKKDPKIRERERERERERGREKAPYSKRS
ncbi:MAG: hypothetical protein Q8P67_02530 [archaeon]|nr:hypothetical protein [archaeon]